MAEPAWAKKYRAEAPLENLEPLMLRRRVRYNLFRLQTEANEGAKADSVPKGFKKFYADQEWFDGWENFGITWDVGDPQDESGLPPEEGGRGSQDPLEVVPRYLSVNEEWDEVVAAHVKTDEITTRKRTRRKKLDDE